MENNKKSEGHRHSFIFSRTKANNGGKIELEVHIVKRPVMMELSYGGHSRNSRKPHHFSSGRN